MRRPGQPCRSPLDGGARHECDGSGFDPRGIPAGRTLVIAARRAGGGFNVNVVSAVRGAAPACVPPPITPAQQQSFLANAQCMREHGVPNFPNPTFPAAEGSVSTSTPEASRTRRRRSSKRARRALTSGHPSPTEASPDRRARGSSRPVGTAPAGTAATVGNSGHTGSGTTATGNSGNSGSANTVIGGNSGGQQPAQRVKGGAGCMSPGPPPSGNSGNSGNAGNSGNSGSGNSGNS